MSFREMMSRSLRPGIAASLACGLVLTAPPQAFGQAVAVAPTQTAAERQVAVTVNGVPIGQEDVDRLVRREVALGRKDSPEMRAAIRERLVTDELLYQEAVRRKLDQAPGFRAAMRAAERQALASLVLRSATPAPVTDADLRQSYERAVAGLAANDSLLAAIVVADQTAARQVWTELARGREFAQLARTRSILGSARNGGLLGWMNLKNGDAPEDGSTLPSAVKVAVRQLAKGGMAGPIADERGRWWIVKLADVRPTQRLAYEQASPRLRQNREAAAKEQARRALVADLRKAATIK